MLAEQRSVFTRSCSSRDPSGQRLIRVAEPCFRANGPAVFLARGEALVVTHRFPLAIIAMISLVAFDDSVTKLLLRLGFGPWSTKCCRFT